MIISYPDKWRIKVEEEITGKIKDIYVTQECFNLVNVGDWILMTPNIVVTMNRVQKHRSKKSLGAKATAINEKN